MMKHSYYIREVVDGRISVIPQLKGLPKHDFDLVGEHFIRAFGRGFIRGNKLIEYVHCIVTDKCKRWVFSNGQLLVTRPDAEVYV